MVFLRKPTNVTNLLCIVLPPIERHKVFSVQMLISNTGTRARNLTITLPSSTSGPSAMGKNAASLAALRHKSTPDLFMDPDGNILLSLFLEI